MIECEAATNRQTGMAAGEDLHPRLLKDVLNPDPIRRIIQRVDRKSPTGQRFGIAMHYANPDRAHSIAGDHRQ